MKTCSHRTHGAHVSVGRNLVWCRVAPSTRCQTAIGQSMMISFHVAIARHPTPCAWVYSFLIHRTAKHDPTTQQDCVEEQPPLMKSKRTPARITWHCQRELKGRGCGSRHVDAADPPHRSRTCVRSCTEGTSTRGNSRERRLSRSASGCRSRYIHAEPRRQALQGLSTRRGDACARPCEGRTRDGASKPSSLLLH